MASGEWGEVVPRGGLADPHSFRSFLSLLVD